MGSLNLFLSLKLKGHYVSIGQDESAVSDFIQIHI